MTLRRSSRNLMARSVCTQDICCLREPTSGSRAPRVRTQGKLRVGGVGREIGILHSCIAEIAVRESPGNVFDLIPDFRLEPTGHQNILKGTSAAHQS